jgi:hypothetical protein
MPPDPLGRLLRDLGDFSKYAVRRKKKNTTSIFWGHTGPYAHSAIPRIEKKKIKIKKRFKEILQLTSYRV